MASAAETYFNSFPAAEQQRIRASWAGNPNGMQDWFNAAVGAGAVGPDGNPRDPNAGAGSDYAAQTGHTQGQSANVSGASGLRKGQTPSPAQLRQYAKENNWPEDFDRFNDATLQSWISNNWNPKTMMFTSEKGVPGDVFKPVDVPEGYTAWGQGAIKNEDLPAWARGAGAAGAGAAPGSASAAASSAPAGPQGQNDLIDALKTHAGYFSQFGTPTEAKTLAGGGIQWTDQAANSGPAAGAPSGAAALAAATLNAFSPQAPSKVAAAGAGAPPPAGGYSDPYENAKAGITTPPPAPDVSSGGGTIMSGLGTAAGGGLPGTAGAAGQPAPGAVGTGADQLQAALGRRFTNPNEWWKGGGVAGGRQLM